MAVVGSSVTYVDEHGLEHDALVTARHDGKGRDSTEPIDTKMCINLLIVSDDATQQDQYGRQIQRFSSVQGENSFAAHGRFWRE